MLTTTQHDISTDIAPIIERSEVPVLTAMQRQGDVLVRPIRPGLVANLAPIPPEGIAVVKGEAGGNTHLLQGDGQFAVSNAPAPSLTLGTLVVGEGETAWLQHCEHGLTGIGPGSYVISRQRQQADIVRMVQD